MKISGQETIAKQDVQSPYGLQYFCQDAIGTSSVIRMVLPDGTIVSKAVIKVLTLSDASEVFEVHLS